MVTNKKIHDSSDVNHAAVDSPAATDAAPQATAAAGPDIVGRAVFAVDTTAAGILVRTAFLSEQGQLIDMPAVFPDLAYALDQIEHLRRIVLERFAQAAQVGAQVIAASQAAQAAQATSAEVSTDADTGADASPAGA